MRDSRPTVLMKTAYVWAEQSTCTRLNVGCVAHREGRILAQGYNGAPSGLPHCNHRCDCNPRTVSLVDPRVKISTGKIKHADSCRSLQPCHTAVHAEQNVISFAARWGVGLGGAELSVTHQPCLSCAMSIINAGITKVWFVEPYRLQDGLNLLIEAGIRVERMVDFEIPS